MRRLVLEGLDVATDLTVDVLGGHALDGFDGIGDPQRHQCVGPIGFDTILVDVDRVGVRSTAVVVLIVPGVSVTNGYAIGSRM